MFEIDYQAMYLALERDADNLSRRIAELERDKVRLESEAMYGAAGFQAAIERIAELEQEVERFKSANKILSEKVVTRRNSAVEARRAASDLMATNMGLWAEAEDTKAERDTLRAELEACRKQLETVTEWYSNSLDVIREVSESIPGVAYMDPPDGGDVSIPEQIRRMAKDAERYRWLRSLPRGANIGGGMTIVLSKIRPVPNDWCVDHVRNEALDTAIDAAMQEGSV